MKTIVVRIELKPNDKCDKSQKTLVSKKTCDIVNTITKILSEVDMTDINFDIFISAQ